MLGEKRRIAALKRKRQRQRERALERERIRAQREWEKRNCKTSNDGYGYGYNSYANLRCVADRIIEGLFSISRRYFTLWTSYREIPSNLKNPGDDKGDATRHMYFQTLLCNNYGGSMQARLDFAKEAGDLYEECGSNNSDSTLMDYHNNAVGRDIYRRLARYEWQEVSYYFFWYYERRLAYINPGSLLGEAERLAEDAINVSDKVKQEEYESEYPEKEYDIYKICFRSHWIKYNLRWYLYKNPDKRNKPLILK